MRINGISSNLNFGKTVRVNMSEKDAYSVAELVNSNWVSFQDRATQKEAKKVFDDTYNGKAVVCSPDNGKSYYILSGKESKKLERIKRRKTAVLQSIVNFYEDGPFLDSSIKYTQNREKSEINKLISSTKENYVLSMYKDDERGIMKLYKLGCIK